MSALRLYLFGPPRVELNGTPVNFQRRKALALLIYLAMRGQPHSRDTLATLFWPDYSQSQARAYLRRDLAVLNTSLAGEWLVADREIVELTRTPELWLDVAEFGQLLAACRSHTHSPQVVCADCLPLLAKAVALYTDDFVAGFTLRDSPEFDDWQFFQTESLRQDLAVVLERLVQGYSAQGESETAIPYARRWLALDPLHEPAQRQLMQVYDQSGQPAAALRQYEEYSKLLEKELGLPPEQETTTLYEAIKARRLLKPFQAFTQEQAGKHKLSSTLHPAASIPLHNLPAQPTSFIGREKELDEIKQLLLDSQDCHLLTLAGPGGIGKTRLALETAAQVIDAFPHGVYFVPLAPVSEAEFIVSAIAEALSLNFHGGNEPKVQLLSYLQEKKLLLVIDNLEHLLAGVELLSEILKQAPGVRLLVTSRERLNLQEEWSYDLRGMSFPAMTGAVSSENLQTLAEYSAVRLFVQRARRARASFNLTVENVPAVIRICQLVEGMPLGLELAAPWVRLMSCQEIVAEIERNFDILATPLHNISERHRSLRGIFEQTWQRLTEAEQAILSKLSIFRGGCLREAAEAVTGATLPLLLSLLDKALLRRARSGRYEMHELIRQFALEQLQADSDEYERTQDNHSKYYTSFLQQHLKGLKGGQQKENLEAITAEIDNVRAAWNRAVECKDAATLEQAAECLCLYSEMRGALAEGEAAFQQAVAAFATTEPIAREIAAKQVIVRGMLLAGQGMLRAHRGGLKEGQALLEQGLSLIRQFDHHERHLPEEAFALMWLGWTLFLQGKNAEAEQVVQQSLDLYSQIGDRWGVARNLFVLGNSLTARGQLAESEPPLRESLATCQDIDDRRSCLLVNRNLAILTFWFGDYPQTRQLLDSAAMLSQEFDDQIGLAYTLRELGKLEIAQGEYVQARQTLQKSIAITDEIGSQWESAATLDDLGVALRVMGDYEAAERVLSQCLEASQRINNRYYTARCFGDLGCVAYHRGEHDRAEQLLGQALDIWQKIGHEPYRAWVLSQLGYVMDAIGGKRQAEAGHYFTQALRLSIKHNLAPFALDIFAGVARLLARSSQTHDIPELLYLAEQHVASAYETKEKARSLLNELAVELPNDIAASAGQALDWQAVAERIIEVLSTPPGQNL